MDFFRGSLERSKSKTSVDPRLSSHECKEKEPVILIADLFSMWNKSVLSSKPIILENIYTKITSNSGKYVFKQKYYTGDNAKVFHNTGHLMINQGDLFNMEIELHQKNEKNTLFCNSSINSQTEYHWKTFRKDLKNRSIIIEFCLDFREEFGNISDRHYRCELKLNESYMALLSLEEDPPEEKYYKYDYFILESSKPGSENCRLIS